MHGGGDMSDPRIVELEALALEEGFRLPMAAERIISLESHGYIVDLHNGEVCGAVAVAVSRNAQALCHLYGMSDNDIEAMFAPVEEEPIELDLFDDEGEAEDLEEDMLDREFHAGGMW
jgi:hypothetical protein